MINENKIRQIYKSNREQGFQLLVECFQEPIYYYIRRLVVLHEDAEIEYQPLLLRQSQYGFLELDGQLIFIVHIVGSLQTGNQVFLNIFG